MNLPVSPRGHDPKTSPADGTSTEGGMQMPDAPAPTLGSTPNPSAPPLPPPPTAFGKQMAQLIVIPAIIVIASVGIAVLFGALAGAPDSIENHLIRLRQSSGAGRIAFNVQDPRYKDRCYAAANIAQMLPTIKDPSKRAAISRDLADILATSVGKEEYDLQAFLLLAMGQIGETETLPILLSYHTSSSGMVRMAVPRSVSSWADAGHTADQWPSRAAAYDAAMPVLEKLVQDGEPSVAAEAARVIGVLSLRGDARSLAALHEAVGRVGPSSREVQWNAAIALARLGDDGGSRVVAGVLLNREALAKLPATELGPNAQQAMRATDQDHVILHTLAAVPGYAGSVSDAIAPGMDSQIVWDRIAQIADSDPNMAVRKAAISLMNEKKRGADGSASQDGVDQR